MNIFEGCCESSRTNLNHPFKAPISDQMCYVLLPQTYQNWPRKHRDFFISFHFVSAVPRRELPEVIFPCPEMALGYPGKKKWDMLCLMELAWVVGFFKQKNFGVANKQMNYGLKQYT